MSTRLWTVAISALAITACGTRIGQQTNGSGAPPTSIITPIGHKATSANGADPVAITVRSGSDVILSGKDSQGVSAAIKTFTWKQTAGPPLPALPDPGALLYRTSNTVDFRAPQVATNTTFGFSLTVTDAHDVTATANVQVTVQPADDSDQFLTLPTAPHHFEVAVATVEGLAGLSADAPVCINVARQVQYTSRDGTQQTVALPQTAALSADTSWKSGSGAAAAGQSGVLSDASVLNAVNTYSNLRVAFDVPTFNDDVLFAMFNQPVANESATALDARRAKQLVASDVDSAHLFLSITAAPGSCDQSLSAPQLATKTLVVALLDSNGNVAAYTKAAAAGGTASLSKGKGAATLTSDVLLTDLTTGAVETAQSAQAYYKALDPAGARTTLDNWLDANCFDHTATDYGVGAAGANGAHAVYTNNFDLGFGRDMYFVKCTADHKNAAGVVTAHAGDMASVVVNYTSLEQAALKQSPIIAVAMEYSGAAAGTATSPFTKFYVFAPDDRDGALKRVASANFDHRGQKYVPGACTACHGGTLPTLPAGFTSAVTYPVIQDPTKDSSKDATNCIKTAAACLPPGNVDAAFLPWDLDSLLYSDTDPAFTGVLISGSAYTRSAQEAGLKALNKLVYGTFQPEIETVSLANGSATPTSATIDRYAGSRKLVEKWYGGAGLPNATYSDKDTPTGWTSPSAADALYHNVFARNCRACHTANPLTTIQWTGLDGFTNDGYKAFIDEFAKTNGTDGRGTAYVFQETIMPAARLTADRFWVNYAGGDSAATLLATHVAQVNGATDLLDSSKAAVPPGHPLPTLTVNGSPADAVTGKFATTRFTGARVDASASFFVAKYDWSLCVKPTPSAACAPLPLVGSTTAAPGISTTAFGNYQLTLTADNGVGETATKTYEIDVPDALPQPAHVLACPAGQSAPFNTGGPGTPIQIMVGGCFSALGDAPYTVKISTDGVTYSAAAITDPTGPWNASVVPSTPVIDPNSGRDTAVPGISFNFTQHATGTTNNTLFYEVCDTDNECATGTVAVMLAGSLTPSSATLTAFWDPTVNANSTGYLTGVSGGLPISPSAAPSPSASLSVLNNSLVVNVPSTFDVKLTLTALTTGTLSSTVLSGTSPANFATLVAALRFGPQANCVNLDLNGNAIPAGSGVCTPIASFKDTLTSSQVPAPTPPASDTGTVTINVQALTSFNQASLRSPSQPSVFAILSENGLTAQSCSSSSCHSSTSSGTGVVWKYTAGSPGATFTSIIGDANLVPGDPENSEFYTAPCKAALDPAMPKVFATNSAECQIIYQWILEGAASN